VAELADARDLKSLAGNSVPVRTRPAALEKEAGGRRARASFFELMMKSILIYAKHQFAKN
jgi:hypothetical protein